MGTDDWVVVSWDERQCIFARVQTYLFRKVTEFKKKMKGTESEFILQKGHFLSFTSTRIEGCSLLPETQLAAN